MGYGARKGFEGLGRLKEPSKKQLAEEKIQAQKASERLKMQEDVKKLEQSAVELKGAGKELGGKYPYQ